MFDWLDTIPDDAPAVPKAAQAGAEEGRPVGDECARREEIQGRQEEVLSPEEERAHAFLNRVEAMRRQGRKPEHYTAECYCSGCGTVWLWEGAPVKVLACPWCFNRIARLPIPHPSPFE